MSDASETEASRGCGPKPEAGTASPARITSLGGGHGLFQTLSAARQLTPESITAVVTVADDGGSSGRIRRELGQIPPGDLRMAIAALASDDPEVGFWAEALQHRFGGHGALAGHAVGNLLIAGLVDVLGSEIAALDAVARITRSTGRVLPVCAEPLDIEADVAGLDEDPRIVRPVRGQVAVASTPGTVRRVRLIPPNPEATPEAVEAIRNADMVTLGPGSWFTSVIPHLMVPGVAAALDQTEAQKVVVLNLTAEPGETAGFSAERHIHMLIQHTTALQIDTVIVDASTIPSAVERSHLKRAAAQLGATVEFHEVRARDHAGRLGNVHDPALLGAALRASYERGRAAAAPGGAA